MSKTLSLGNFFDNAERSNLDIAGNKTQDIQLLSPRSRSGSDTLYTEKDARQSLMSTIRVKCYYSV